MSNDHGILFTAFEPSGDEHAAAVIEQLKKHQPDLKIWGTGGERMAAAGAEIIETTVDRAAMIQQTIKEIPNHLQRIDRMSKWLEEHSIIAHVPVDSPAANWAICKLVRKKQPGAKIVHLVCPQIWAWASWRIRKLRRLTDHVLCLLPFEPKWLQERGVTGTFVGHPVFNAENENKSNNTSSDIPDAELKLGLLPGSRMSEVTANWPTMLEVFHALHERHPQLKGAVAAVDQRVADCIKELSSQSPYKESQDAIQIFVNEGEQVMNQSDVILVTSGTATLHVTGHKKPMVVMYNASRLVWHLFARYVVTTPRFSLPNLISRWQDEPDAVTEFCPHFRDAKPIIEAVDVLICDSNAREQQREKLNRIASAFDGHDWGSESAEKLLSLIRE